MRNRILFDEAFREQFSRSSKNSVIFSDIENVLFCCQKILGELHIIDVVYAYD